MKSILSTASEFGFVSFGLPVLIMVSYLSLQVPEVDTAVRSLTVMWDGSLVVAANNNGTCYVWRLLRGTQVECSFTDNHFYFSPFFPCIWLLVRAVGLDLCVEELLEHLQVKIYENCGGSLIEVHWR